MNIKVLHSGTMGVNAEGSAMSTYYTLYGLRQQQVDAEIIMFPIPANGKLRGTEVPIHYAPAPWEHKFMYSLGCKLPKLAY